MPYSPRPLSTAADARRIASDFGALYCHVLNTSVTHDNVRVVPVWTDDWRRTRWIISAVAGVIPLPLELTDGNWLLAAQTVGVREARDGQLWLTTLRYKYQWQADEEGADWWVRWDYRRETQEGELIPRHERAHVHLNGTPPGYTGPPDFHKRHLPAGRVGIEDIVHYLVNEGGCTRISHNCDEVINEARRIFDDIQQRRQ